MFDPRSLFTRRRALRTAAGAAAVAAGGAVLAACGSSTTGAATGSASAAGILPVPQSGVTHLYFQPNTQGSVSWNKTTQALFQEFVDANFNQNPHYKGLWATARGPWGGESTQAADVIAGSGADDVWHFCCGDVPAAIHGGLAAQLDDLLRRDNISTDNWSKGHLIADSLAGKLYGLPSYDGTMTCIYRQDLLDELGLPYPSPDWTGKTALQIWESCTGKNKTGGHRTGVNIYYGQEDLDWWLHGWGASEMNAAQDQGTMSTTAAGDCFTYLQNMFSAGITRPETRGVHNLIAETTCFQMAHSAYVINAAVELGNKYKWDFLPNPIWSTSRACMETIDCYMMNAAAKNQDAAWELFKWISLGTPNGDGTYDYAWPKFQIKINLITPSLVALWDYWTTTIQEVAPPLKGKSLQWWSDPAIKGYARPQLFYVYNYAQAETVEGNWMTQIRESKVTPQTGLRQMQDQVNAIEAAGQSQSKAGASMAKEFPTTGNAEAAMPTGI